jgi:D-tagatose-1,6-bisphosphate aldolase subunit GatZ/KbaZ
MDHRHYLHEVVASQKRGEAKGIYSVCSANRYVIEAALLQGIEDESMVLIESTCNQVNQFGGYTGMKPEEFNRFVLGAAASLGFPVERLILGGDHLGPYPFRHDPFEQAMAKTIDMVKSFVHAGNTKIHIDASYRISDEPVEKGGGLSPRTIAERCGLLCRHAEEAFVEHRARNPKAAAPMYVIGTEVPAPGGSETREPEDRITKVADFEETVALTRSAFRKEKIDGAWERVVAVVVEPGVEYGNQTILEYDRTRTRALAAALTRCESLIFEAHSTDYQPTRVLKQMVEDGFAILKTGPVQTAAVREAVFMLARIEEECFGGKRGGRSKSAGLSRFVETLDRVMVEKPVHWKGHYREGDAAFQRKYSFFDRQRYYWSEKPVIEALDRLIANLRSIDIPLALLSQFLPEQYKKVQAGLLDRDPESLIRDRAMDHMREYAWAVGNRKAAAVDWWSV